MVGELDKKTKVQESKNSYILVNKEFKPKRTIVSVGGVEVGGKDIALIAGPCSVESEEQLSIIAETLVTSGIKIMRAGIYKPSTSPYNFQGLGDKGLEIFVKIASTFGLKTITEVMDVRLVDKVAEHTDILQIGSRNMHNQVLLKEVGRSKKPVLLKRGMSATYEEWLLAAEYIALEGNENIILCERGIRSFDQTTRNTLDLAAVPMMRQLTHLPIIVDPSHGTGRRELISPLSKAAVACGADGLMIEIHPEPNKALKDGFQSLDLDEFKTLVKDIGELSKIDFRNQEQKRSQFTDPNKPLVVV